MVAVKVGPRHYDEARHLIYRWAQQDHGSQPAAVICENLLDRVARLIGLKAPYRSALSGSNPVAYLRDLDRTNR